MFSSNFICLNLEKKPSFMQPITLQEFKKLLLDPDKLQIIDVRSKEEHFDKRIRGGKNIPLDELFSHAPNLNHSKNIVVHCAHGFRAKRAAEYLEKVCHLHVYYLKGDIENWEHMDLPVLYGDET